MRNILVSLLIFCCYVAFSQSTFDQSWQERYWKTRLNFQNNFCVIGVGPGKSMPFNRNYSPVRECENPLNISGSRTFVGNINAGDATIRLGQYIAALSLEYRNLANSGQNTDRTLKELYFAILAVERLDQFAEFNISGGQQQYLPLNNSSVLNGYFIRDDFESDFWSSYDNKKENNYRQENEWGIQWANDPMLHKRFIATDNNLACGYGAQSGTANVFNEDNHVSQDQLLGLLVGFSVVKKMNVDVNFSPGAGYASINILGKCVEITRRIMDHFTEVKTYYVGENLKFSMNYCFVNPITGNFPLFGGSPAGSAYFLLGYAFGTIANEITSSNDYSKHFRIKMDVKNLAGNFVPFAEEIIRFDNTSPGSVNNAGLGVFIVDAFQAMDPNNSNWMVSTTDNLWGSIGLSFLTQAPHGILISSIAWNSLWHRIGDAESLEDSWNGLAWGNFDNSNQSEVNKRLFLLLAAVMPNTVHRNDFHSKAFNTNYNFHSLLFDVMHDDGTSLFTNYTNASTPLIGQYQWYGSSQQASLDLLDSFPCGGPGWFPANPASRAESLINGYCPIDPTWAGTNIIIEKSPTSCSNLESNYYPGVDYMFLYNLYHYRFGGNVPFTDATGCNCDGYDDPIRTIPLDLTSGNFTNDYTIKRKQNGDTWNSFDFELFEYTSGNKNFGSYDLNINGGLILCKGLFTFSNGVVNVGSATEVGNFVIQNDGELDLSNTTLTLFPGSTLTIKTGGTLRLNTGGNLFVQSLGNVIIEEGGTLILNGGTTTFTGGDGDLIVRGGISFQNTSSYIWNPTGQGNIYFGKGCYIIGNPSLNSIKFDQTAVILWVEDEVALEFPPFLEQVEFIGTTIYLGKDSYMSFLSKTGVSGCNVTRWPNEISRFAHNGLVYWGAEGLDPRDNRPLVYNTTFSHGKYGIRSFQNLGAKKSIIVSGCQFTDLQTSISISHGGGYVFGNTFTNSGAVEGNIGISSVHSSNFLNIESNLFNELGDAVKMSSSHGYRGVFAGNVFNTIPVGINALQGSISLKCNYFLNNWYAVETGDRNYLSATRDNTLMKFTSAPIYAGDNAVVSLLDYNTGFAINGTSIMYVKNGLNFFDHTNTASRHISSYNIKRSQNIPNGFVTIDNDFGQNIWGHYAPPSGSNSNWLFMGDIDEQYDNAYQVRISVHPNLVLNAVGTVATSPLTCQISEWSGALNPSTFIPGSTPGILFKNQPISGIADPFGGFTGGTYSSGPLMGQTYLGALNGVYSGITEIKYDRYVISTENFSQFGIVLQNSFAFEANYDVTTAALSDYLNFGQNLLEINENNPTVQQQVFNQIQTTLLAEQTWLNSTNVTNTEFFNEMMTLNEINMAYLYRGVGDYPNALEHLDDAKAYGVESQDIWIESIECYFQIERDLKIDLIDREMFLHANDSCNAIKDVADAMRELALPYSTSQGAPQTDLVTVTISPNPVTSELLFTISNLSEVEQNVQITIYDKFGIARGTMTVDQEPGNENYSMPLVNAVNDVYSLVYVNNGVLRSIQFILNR